MDSKSNRSTTNFKFQATKNISATWSQWTECLGSCVSSRRRICSENYGCNGLEYEEQKCSNADDTCFRQLSDTLSEGDYPAGMTSLKFF